jgi:hypothetical protein
VIRLINVALDNLVGRLFRNGKILTASCREICTARFFMLPAVIMRSPFYDTSICALIEPNFTIGEARTSVYGSTNALNWESCLSHTCALNPVNTSQTLSEQSSLGSLSSLYVDAREASHVVAAIKFAQAHKLRVSIRNTGHGYFGRSTNPHTLVIWTHNNITLTSLASNALLRTARILEK